MEDVWDKVKKLLDYMPDLLDFDFDQEYNWRKGLNYIFPEDFDGPLTCGVCRYYRDYEGNEEDVVGYCGCKGSYIYNPNTFICYRAPWEDAVYG